MSDDKDKAPQPAPKASTARKDEFPNKRTYEEGNLFGFAVGYYEKYNVEELIKMGYEQQVHIPIIQEAMRFHKLELGSKRQERLDHEQAVLKEGKRKEQPA